MKSEAEKKHGFRLYQGGVVPGNNLRVVQIHGLDGTEIDVEACCGTHCENTGQVGWIKITNSSRISDGILRLSYVAGTKVIPVLNEQTKVLQDISKIWGNVGQDQLCDQASKFFNEYKRLNNVVNRNNQERLKLQIRCILNEKTDRAVILSQEKNATIYFNFFGAYAQQLQTAKKGLVFVGKTFIHGIIGEKNALNGKELSDIVLTAVEEG